MKMKKHFYVTGYIGEGARQMLLDLEKAENAELAGQVIGNKAARFLYYRLDGLTAHFQRAKFLKRLFYPFFTLYRKAYDKEVENIILFLNSGFCREWDARVLHRLKAKHPEVRLVLYMVDPMTGFDSAEHRCIMGEMDRIYSINRSDCEKYGFHYYPLVYSENPDKVYENSISKISDLYYLGSGSDRTEYLSKVYASCRAAGIRTDFHVLGEGQRKEGIICHQEAVPYSENIRSLLGTNCILEIMHKDFDNPTQRYCEAVVYNKRLLTNNKRTADFDFYRPEYIQIFDKIEDIDWSFVQKEEEPDYGYQGEFSPLYLIKKIEEDFEARER